ncbi:MAG: hypothetical protein ACLU6W_00720 [Lachnospiraceae bacterium]|nr:hypothetical protein [Candidatus Fimimorpha excrementavium]
MRFYKNLWVSENAAGKKFQIIWKLKHFRPQSDVYVLVLADTPHDLIHIYPAKEFQQPYYKKRHRDLFVIGIAYTRPEALELARRIVDEVYQKTGDCDIGAYIRNRTDTP